jgi:hypothetical protein
MPDYSKGKIYAIRCTDSDDVYIGSTIESLSRRMTGHRADYKLRPHKCTSSALIGRGTAYIELIEDFPCERVEQLRKREGEIIRSRNCVNRIVAGRTKREYHEENREALLKEMKKYNDLNRDRLLEEKKEYYKENRDVILKQRKEYTLKNKEEKKAYNKEYQLKNKDKIRARQKEARQKKKKALVPVADAAAV